MLQSTGGSTEEDEDDITTTALETKRNTQLNEHLDRDMIEVKLIRKIQTRLFWRGRLRFKVFIFSPRLEFRRSSSSRGETKGKARE